MKAAAIIAEYNPFHNGHRYQLDTLRETIGADEIIIIMSGDFVQRGAPAIVDKYARCRMALLSGADAVFELPVSFALASAEYFAHGAVSLAERLGVTDILYFGSECGDIALLQDCAKIIAEEPPQYRRHLSHSIQEGNTFPFARSEAVRAVLPDCDREKIAQVFAAPNNILALEYLKALLQQKSAITPLTLRRNGADFHDDTLSPKELPSANAIRKHLEDNCGEDNELSFLNGYLPDACLQILQNSTFLFPNDFSQVLLYKLLHDAYHADGFACFFDVGAALSNTLSAKLMQFSSFEDFAALCKSRHLTYTRVCRSLMHILLDMTQEQADQLKADGCGYARLLGFRTKDRRSRLLNRIQENTSIPVITSPAKGLRALTGSALISLKADIHAANIYESVKAQKMTQMSPLNELTRELIRINS